MILCIYKKILTLHNVIILIKSVLNKDKIHYYYRIFVKKCLYQLAKIAQVKFYSAKKKTINIWDANADNIVISKLFITKTNSKYLIGY